ncbi:MAG: ribokinase [Lactobacillus sp.]|nr:ribokinase [Lactobacillus sp.]
MNKVTIIGSINLDRTIKAKRIPEGGETLHADEIFTAGGGKGANQAVASARLGADTHLIGAVGQDADGKNLLADLAKDGVNVDAVVKLADLQTGQAFIMLDANSENRIMVYGGANLGMPDEQVIKHKQIISDSDFVVAQFEMQESNIIAGFKLARESNTVTVLNPAPAKKMSPELLALTDVIIPNETEAALLTGVKVEDEAGMLKASQKLHELGIKVVLITVGSKGTFYSYAGKTGLIPAFKVKAVDTTAAGDTFIGAFCSYLKPDFSNLEEAITFSNKASSLTVQREGAQPAIPFLKEINL